jgi:group I intron endonuclease
MANRSGGIVYLITCIPTGRQYVGITCNSIEKRWKMHVWKAYSNEPWKICRAIRKYGPKKFTIKQIDQADTYKALQKLETEHIKRLGTFEHGYNCTLGGEKIRSGSFGKKHTVNGQVKTLREWSEFVGLPKKLVESRMRQNGWSLKKSLFATKEDSTKLKFVTFKGQRKSTQDWAKETEISNHNILQRIRNGWSVHRALSTATGGAQRVKLKFKGLEKSIKQWSNETGLSEKTIRSRLGLGWSVKKILCRPVSKSVKMVEFKGRCQSTKMWATELGMSRELFYDRIKRWGIKRAIETPVPKSKKK